MRLAVVGWATESGVGRELCDAAANLPLVGAFLLTHVSKRNRFELVPGATVSHGRDPFMEMTSFIEASRPDTVLTWEIPGRWEFPEVWRAKGVRWVNVVHWDWFPADQVPLLASADLVAPNEMCREGLAGRYGLSSTLLPVPLDVRRFPFSRRRAAQRFGMAYGAGGPTGRRSLGEVLEAWGLLKNAPPLEIRAQIRPPEFVPSPWAELLVGSLPDPAAVYSGYDVAVQPSRFEGVGLSILEAQACGLPVITVDAEPMRSLAPDLLVPAARGTVAPMKGHEVDSWTPSVPAIASLVERLRDSDIGPLSEAARRRAELNSWDVLRPRWTDFLRA